MDKEVLVQYCAMKEEIKDLRRRIAQLDRFLEHPPIVSDTVRGSRQDLTIGPIEVTGIPDPEYGRKNMAREYYRKLLEAEEAELLELTCQAEEFISSIPDSKMRIMLRLYYIDGLPWIQVAHKMNQAFPQKLIKYTEDSCRKRNARFFEEI